MRRLWLTCQVFLRKSSLEDDRDLAEHYLKRIRDEF